jgi:hypothetical protein
VRSYGTPEVERLLGMPAATIRSFVSAVRSSTRSWKLN